MPNDAVGGPRFEVIGLPELLRVLDRIPKDLAKEARDAANAIASDLIEGAQSAAGTSQQRLAASGLELTRGDIPAIMAGSAMIRPNVMARDLFYGAEFGGGSRPATKQFPPFQGKRGYFLYPTFRNRAAKYADLIAKAADNATKDFDYKAR